jgi:beta-mannosidase
MNRYYGEPKDLSSFLYSSQVLQAEAVKTGAEGWRRARPQTMGTIFWQLNVCWPVASWSSVDYDGRWKALQYYARRFYAPVLVSQHQEDGSLAIYVVKYDKFCQGEVIEILRNHRAAFRQLRHNQDRAWVVSAAEGQT